MAGGHAIVTFLADPDATDYSAWLCSSCWRCQEACPVGIDIHQLMMEQRRRQRTPAGYQNAIQRVRQSSLALEISQEELHEVRAAWGLEPARVPPGDLARLLLEEGLRPKDEKTKGSGIERPSQ